MNSGLPSVLQKIAESVRSRLLARQGKIPFARLKEQALTAPKPKDFVSVFRAPVPTVKTISEIKFTSPAVGKLSMGNTARAVAIAGSYLQGGTTAISVLTEEDHFQGSSDHLRAIRAQYPHAFLLMKDFMLEEYQILEALLNGADCILLIVALLGKSRTLELKKFAQEQGLSVLVEVHDENELESALEINAPMIGVNNRNLKTLKVSLETSFRLAKVAKNHSVMISESGIQTGQEIKQLSDAGYAGFLVGTSLMHTPDPGAALAELLRAANS